MRERCPTPGEQALCFHEEKVEKLRESLPEEGCLTSRASALKAVGHPGRLAVLHLVALEECCVCDVAHTLQIPVSTASQHLRRLKAVGLLTSRSDGRFVFYAPAVPERVHALLSNGIAS